MDVGNSEDSCNFNEFSNGINHSFAISTEPTAFGRTSVEAPVSSLLLTVRKHSKTLHPKRKERAKNETLVTHREHHRRYVVEHVLRSYSCSSSSGGRMPFSSLPASSSSKRRLPLTSIATRKKLKSSSTLRRAVLPRWRRRLYSEKFPKRFGHSVVAKRDLVESMLQRAMADRAEDYLHSHCLGVHNSTSGCTRTIYSAAVGREVAQGIHTNNDGIDSATIFRQLNILKTGGYWKYLLLEDAQEEEQDWDEEMLPEERSNRVRKEASKENFPRASHPNTCIGYRNQREWEWDDEEDYEEEGRTHRNIINPFVGSALQISNKNDIGIECIGFRVQIVTKDGWMCSSEQFCCGSNNCNGATAGSTRHQQQHLVLLHLPSKLAALGRHGMYIRGMDLMKRRDNGAVEPHTHHHANTGYGNGNGILGDHPSTITDHCLLFGRISL